MYRGQHPLLFQLLNEMDGLAEDADVVFVLTTNRADLLEPALAARPGPGRPGGRAELPDADARRRLFELYRGSLAVDESRLDEVLERTDGRDRVLPQGAAAPGGTARPPRAGDGAAPHRGQRRPAGPALDELLDTRNAMTRVLLGATRSTPATLGDES